MEFNRSTMRRMCHECFTGKHRCYLCKEHTNKVVKCSEQNCGKFYHLKCLQAQGYPHKIIDRKKGQFRCPLHFCLTCFNEPAREPPVQAIEKELVACVKCATAYHAWNDCLAAGSHFIGSQCFVCPEHPEPAKRKESKKNPRRDRDESHEKRRILLNWCLSCDSSDDLVHCEKCPAGKHQRCILQDEGEEPVAGAYHCADCRTRKQLRYGDLVWVKAFSLRWWPAQIVAIENVPENIWKLPHPASDLPIYFFGTHDYYWLSRSNMVPYRAGDEKRRIVSVRRGHLLNKFKLALEEVRKAYKVRQKEKEWSSKARESGRH